MLSKLYYRARARKTLGHARGYGHDMDESQMHRNYFFLLLAVLTVKALAIAAVILHAGIGLGPDEAQYWTWSRLLDWGYYSKPPGIAWEIRLGTSLFGNTEFGVRSMPLLIGFAIPLALYLTARCCRLSPQTCFWAAIALAFSPLGILSSFLAITDGGMILFWTLSCAYLVDKIEKQELLSGWVLGLLVFFGALFKWTMYIFWLVILAAWLWHRRPKHLFVGALLSLAALLPSLYWNASHDWVTFRHVLATLAGGHAKAKGGGNFFEFLGAQIALMSPIFFVMLLMGWRHVLRKKSPMPPGVLFCGRMSLFILAAAAIVSLFMKVQGNWAVFAYPTAFVLLAWYGCLSRGKRRWLIGGAALSLLLTFAAFSLPYGQSHSLVPISYRINPFRHNLGWERLGPILEEAGYDPQKDFLFGDKYQTASILSFYGPEQKRAYFLNLGGARKNQFSFWPDMAKEQKGKRGFFVVAENIPQLNDVSLVEKYTQALSPYFEEVRFLGMHSLFKADGRTVKGALLFECQGYSGLAPADPELY